jgi:hypothetical protein
MRHVKFVLLKEVTFENIRDFPLREISGKPRE